MRDISSIPNYLIGVDSWGLQPVNRFLMLFKRNQVEAAISRLFEPGSANPRSELRTRMKRLLETDRSFGRNKRSADPGRVNFAFYSGEAPGRGVEIWFSGYEAFALLTALRLMHHSWPQGFAVAVLRYVRPELERHHHRILQQDPPTLFDQQQILKNAKAGDLAVGNTDPVFLAIISQDARDQSRSPKAAVARGQGELMGYIRSEAVVGQVWSTLELVNSAHALFQELAKTKPSKRGRGN